jgi:hypothetical protein
VIPFHPGLVVAGVSGLLVAVVVLRPLLRTAVSDRRWWAPVAAAGTALTLLFPVVLLIFDQTRHFRARGLTEVGSAAFKEPPMSEEAARAFRAVLRPGESWATTTPLGRCADIDLYAFYWMAFRLVPNPPDCVDPDVELYLRRDPPGGAAIITQGDGFAVVRP